MHCFLFVPLYAPLFVRRCSNCIFWRFSVTVIATGMALDSIFSASTASGCVPFSLRTTKIRSIKKWNNQVIITRSNISISTLLRIDYSLLGPNADLSLPSIFQSCTLNNVTNRNPISSLRQLHRWDTRVPHLCPPFPRASPQFFAILDPFLSIILVLVGTACNFCQREWPTGKIFFKNLY